MYSTIELANQSNIYIGHGIFFERFCIYIIYF